MRNLNKPKISVKEVLLKCLSNLEDSDLKKRLIKCLNDIIIAEDEFEKNKISGKLHETKIISIINELVSTSEIKKIYTTKMVPVNSPGRFYYDSLISSAPNGRCPLCSHRDVNSIDHHLPKSKYPIYSVTPINLVPACTDCNGYKDNNILSDPEKETLHPYYDNIEEDNWLDAEVLKTSPPSIRFFVIKPESWDSVLFNRVKHHFDSLYLNKLYSNNAASELVGINKILKASYLSNDWNGVRFRLIEKSESWAETNINSWQAVLYRTVGNDKWYCQEGFKYQSNN